MITPPLYFWENAPVTGAACLRPVNWQVYARHGRELMGCKSPMCEPGQGHRTLTQTLADGKGGVVRPCPKEARGVVGAGGEPPPGYPISF